MHATVPCMLQRHAQWHVYVGAFMHGGMVGCMYVGMAAQRHVGVMAQWHVQHARVRTCAVAVCQRA
eukprot:362038-Chlamydomonas_euryale.AAC.5